MLIQAYGEYWNPDVVDWGSRGKGNKGVLDGSVRIKGKKYTVDFWDAVGVYVLIDEFRPVYVGKAVNRRLGPRLRDHLTDRFAGRWNMFSWFSQSTINTTHKNLRQPGTRPLNPDTVTNTLEALAILITDPPLNRKHESLPGANVVEQLAQPVPKTIRKYLEEISAKLDARDE